MNNLPKTKIDLSKIKGPYPLLGIFLVVVEGLLGFWLLQADDNVERIIAGILMTLLLFGVLIVIVILIKKEDNKNKIVPYGLDREVTPAKDEATKKEIESPTPERIGAPDGSYSIIRPPVDWTVRELSMSEWAAEMLNLDVTSVNLEQLGFSPQQIQDKVFVFDSPRVVSVLPIPGKTIINNRKIPSALETNIPTKLSIMPLDRAQPPFYIEHTFLHNMILSVGQVLVNPVLMIQSLKQGKMKESGREFLVAEFIQEVRCATINGIEEQDINFNITVIGIKGELKDHLLIMHYPAAFIESKDVQSEKDLEALESLINSFRPLRAVNPDEISLTLKNTADKNFKDLMESKGEDMFSIEFGMLILRLKNLDLDDLEERNKAIRYLKSFEAFAKEVNIEDEGLIELWESLEEAKKGDATNFKELLVDMIDDFDGELGCEEDINNGQIGFDDV